MNDKEIIPLKTKVFKNIIIGIVGVLILYLGLVNITSSLWYILVVLVGLFLTYNCFDVLAYPMGIVLVFDEYHLYVTRSKTKKINANKEDIMNGVFYTKKYELSKLENIWRYKVKVNLSVAYEVINAIYDSKKISLVDVSGDYRLIQSDFEKMLGLILKKAPHIQLGKPKYQKQLT